MDVKRIHCMIEKLTEYGECMINEATGNGSVDINEASEIIDMIKDLTEAEYHAIIAKEMKKEIEEEEALEKFGMGHDRRYYDRYRYADGRFAPKGRETRRGYEEPPYYHMTPEQYKEHENDPEYWRDMDRHMGRMYYTETGITRGMDGKSGRMESRSERARRNYTETKELHRSNSEQDKQAKMKDLEHYMNELNADLTELLKEMTPEERTIMKTKITTLATKL